LYANTHAKSSLEAGLVALKQGNYETAIAHLEPVASSESNGTANLQARVGLVMAYARCGEVSKAIAISQNLIETNNPQVQEWATRALEHLTKRKKPEQESKNVETGFVAFDNSPANNPPDTPPDTEEKPKDEVIETKNYCRTTTTTTALGWLYGFCHPHPSQTIRRYLLATSTTR
jgi:tetratricopeptide (TPR) repeat protein